MLYIRVTSFFLVLCDQSDNVVQLEGENVDNDIVFDKEKEEAAGVEYPVAKQDAFTWDCV